MGGLLIGAMYAVGEVAGKAPLRLSRHPLGDQLGGERSRHMWFRRFPLASRVRIRMQRDRLAHLGFITGRGIIGPAGGAVFARANTAWP